MVDQQRFDELARGLATNRLSRGRVLRVLRSALVGGALASVPGMGRGEPVVQPAVPHYLEKGVALMTKRLVSMIALAASMALSVLAFAGFASAEPKGHVVRPGQSIQKAINAADPGDTIVVLGASTARA
jgi:hypothetical protein